MGADDFLVGGESVNTRSYADLDIVMSVQLI